MFVLLKLFLLPIQQKMNNNWNSFYEREFHFSFNKYSKLIQSQYILWKFRKHRFFEMRMLFHKRTDTIVPLNKICIWQFLSKAVLLQVIEYFSLQPGICRFVSMRIVELQTLLSTKAFEMFTEVFFLKHQHICVYLYQNNFCNSPV